MAKPLVLGKVKCCLLKAAKAAFAIISRNFAAFPKFCGFAKAQPEPPFKPSVGTLLRRHPSHAELISRRHGPPAVKIDLDHLLAMDGFAVLVG